MIEHRKKLRTVTCRHLLGDRLLIGDIVHMTVSVDDLHPTFLRSSAICLYPRQPTMLKISFIIKEQERCNQRFSSGADERQIASLPSHCIASVTIEGAKITW
jgi:hypothetical protein